MTSKTFENRKAFYDYHVLEKMEVGVALEGWEIKAIRAGRMSLAGSWVRPSGTQWNWFGEINPLEQASTHVKAVPWKERRVLMSTSESKKWMGKVQERGLTVVPLRGYFKGRWFKLELGLVRGKNDMDKRQTIKDADAKKDVSRAMKVALKTNSAKA
jgi:SsrA-binding protein